jgi:hypothetical protein
LSSHPSWGLQRKSLACETGRGQELSEIALALVSDSESMMSAGWYWQLLEGTEQTTELRFQILFGDQGEALHTLQEW